MYSAQYDGWQTAKLTYILLKAFFFSFVSGMCPTVACDVNFERLSLAQTGAKEIYTEGLNDEGIVPASTSVFVLEPGEMPSKFGLHSPQMFASI